MANNLGQPRAAYAPAILQRVTQQVFTACAANSTTTFNLTIQGSTPDMLFSAYMPFLDAAFGCPRAHCTAAGTVVLTLGNVTGSTATASTQDFYIASQ